MHDFDAIAVGYGEVIPLRPGGDLAVQLYGDAVRAELEPLENGGQGRRRAEVLERARLAVDDQLESRSHVPSLAGSGGGDAQRPEEVERAATVSEGGRKAEGLGDVRLGPGDRDGGGVAKDQAA